jgi:hypothetical protein
MVRSIALSICLVLIIGGCSTRAKTRLNPGATASLESHNKGVCLLAGWMPSDVKYVTLGQVRASRGSYGHVNDVLAVMANEGRRLGADAIVGLQASQRFGGPLPWRFTRPVGDGTAIRLAPDSPALDCKTVGGTLM